MTGYYAFGPRRDSPDPLPLSSRGDFQDSRSGPELLAPKVTRNLLGSVLMIGYKTQVFDFMALPTGFEPVLQP